MKENTFIVVAWHNPEQKQRFLDSWWDSERIDNLILQQDVSKEGCARTKNKGIEKALSLGAKIVVVLDDDCFPTNDAHGLASLAEKHERCLEPQKIEGYEVVTEPFSRGTPFLPENRTVEIPMIASMGFWEEIGDYDAPSQLVHGARKPMTFKKQVIFGKFFPLSGMNVAFDAKYWPWFKFIDVPRYDDIWAGYILQTFAYSNGLGFNLNGPTVRHSRQSNVWQNLKDEAKWAEANETLWRKLAGANFRSYEDLRRLLPV